jgi:hypothetical protein
MSRVLAAIRVAAVIAAAASIDTGSGVAAAPALRLTVTPHFGNAPAHVRVQVFVERAAENRALRLTIDSPEYFRSSAIELNGESAQRVHVAEFRSIPAGAHEVRAALVNRRGEESAVVHEYIRIYD